MIGIYKYTNKLNNNSYIGKSIDIERRYQQHLYDAKWRPGISGIDMAINKYGIENFTFEIIEECSEEQLNNRERYWIAYYDTYHNGYNRTVGGEGLSGEEHPRAILMANPIANTKVKYRGRKVRNINTNQVFTSKIQQQNGLSVEQQH